MASGFKMIMLFGHGLPEYWHDFSEITEVRISALSLNDFD
jgi:hypothetical protein